MNIMLDRIKWMAEKVLTSNPYTYFWTKKALERIPWFLPHDPDFNAIPLLVSPQEKILVIDIGANDGISARSIRKLLPNAQIVSFEISPFHARSLERLKKNDLAFDYKIVGLGDTEDQLTLFTPVYKTIPIHSAASLKKDGLKEALATAYPQNIVNKIKIEPSQVKIRTLDSFQLKPNLMKIDAEGYELEILKGALKTIEKNRPILLVEIWNISAQELKKLLSPLNYELWFYRGDVNKSTDDKEQMKKVKNGFMIPAEHSVNPNFFVRQSLYDQ